MIPAISTHDFRTLFGNQKARQPQIRARSARERSRLLRKLKSAIEAHAVGIREAIHEDFSKAGIETDITEIAVVILEIVHAARHVRRWMRPRSAPTPLHLLGTSSEVRYEPKGGVLIIGAWNYPFQLTMAPLVAAIAAGNSVVIKPSELTPATSRIIARIVREVFDPEEVTVVEGGPEVTQELLKLPFNHFFFTGSAKVGRIVLEAAAKHLASVSLELGGKCPVIVDETAPMASTCERLVWGKFVNAGQSCIAPDYVWLPESRLEEFVSEMRKAIEKSYGPGPDAWRSSGDYARIINDRSFGRLKGQLDQTVSAGARIAIGGEVDAAQRYIAPTVVTGVKAAHALMSEEIFGPILPVLTYRSLEGEVLPMIHAGDRPLALYLFSRDRRRVRKILDQTMSGGVTVNNTLLHLISPYVPFGGVGPSGLGSYHGEAGFRELSHERAVVYQRSWNLMRLFFPPYTKRVGKLVQLLLRVLGR